MPRNDSTYLGDSVYVRMDQSFQIELYTHNGISIQDQVYLEPSVWQRLLEWVKAQDHKDFKAG